MPNKKHLQESFNVDIYSQGIIIKDSILKDFVAQVDYPNDVTKPIVATFDVDTVTPTIIVHEVIHIAIYICDRVRLCIDPNNQEPFAYLVDYIFDMTTKAINKIKKQKKRGKK